ncbi:Serine/threonine-protein phosphatase 2A activator [Perkinsus olseni]|uniref:Serine/threonine-protein phosphatase 2A activator n=2 Tax=Perkinsus olseni TaxID=32597 RepID=A0A7J6NUW8_PEROL|nr:Serine/threonine-protein phosphatase 2A activator [Perkinsus olseni]
MPTYSGSSKHGEESLGESLLSRTRKNSQKQSSIVGPICGGILSGFLVIFRAVSFSSVYFKDPILSPHIAVCLQSLLVSGIVAQLCYINHPIKGCISCPSSTSTPFQAALITCIISNLGEAPAASLAVQGALLTFMLSSISFGLSLLLVVAVCKREYLETFKTAFPQPVIYGFFVAIGLAMIDSSLKVVVGEDILTACWNNRICFLQCVASLLCGLLNRFGSRYLHHYLALPGLLMGNSGGRKSIK